MRPVVRLDAQRLHVFYEEAAPTAVSASHRAARELCAWVLQRGQSGPVHLFHQSSMPGIDLAVVLDETVCLVNALPGRGRLEEVAHHLGGLLVVLALFALDELVDLLPRLRPSPGQIFEFLRAPLSLPALPLPTLAFPALLGPVQDLDPKLRGLLV
jgi:hypothetical protein